MKNLELGGWTVLSTRWIGDGIAKADYEAEFKKQELKFLRREYDPKNKDPFDVYILNLKNILKIVCYLNVKNNSHCWVVIWNFPRLKRFLSDVDPLLAERNKIIKRFLSKKSDRRKLIKIQNKANSYLPLINRLASMKRDPLMRQWVTIPGIENANKYQGKLFLKLHRLIVQYTLLSLRHESRGRNEKPDLPGTIQAARMLYNEKKRKGVSYKDATDEVARELGKGYYTIRKYLSHKL